MKRILAAMLVVILAFSSVILLSSCAAKPEMDLEKAKDNLEDEDYSVNYSDEDNETGIEEYLSASKTKGDDYDYVRIIKFSDAKLAKLEYKGLKQDRDTYKKEIKLELEKYEYMLSKYDDELTSEEEDYIKEEIKELEKELEEYDDYVIGRSGKTVWYGTKAAIEASKG